MPTTLKEGRDWGCPARHRHQNERSDLIFISGHRQVSFTDRTDDFGLYTHLKILVNGNLFGLDIYFVIGLNRWRTRI